MSKIICKMPTTRTKMKTITKMNSTIAWPDCFVLLHFLTVRFAITFHGPMERIVEVLTNVQVLPLHPGMD